LLAPDEAPVSGKYDAFVPEALRRQAFARDHLDLEELRSKVTTWEIGTIVV
jgi:ATP-dependent helicase Lhr and Lhr-like helicase